MTAARKSDQAALANQRKHWRDFLTSTETLDLVGLEENARLCDERRLALSRQIQLIRDRCQARRQHAEKIARKRETDCAA